MYLENFGTQDEAGFSTLHFTNVTGGVTSAAMVAPSKVFNSGCEQFVEDSSTHEVYFVNKDGIVILDNLLLVGLHFIFLRRDLC